MATEAKEMFRHTATRNAKCTAQTNDFSMVFCLPAEQSTGWLLLPTFNSHIQVSTCVLTWFCQASYRWMKFPFSIAYLMLLQESSGTAVLTPALPDSGSRQCHSGSIVTAAPGNRRVPRSRQPRGHCGISTNILRPPASADLSSQEKESVPSF